MNRFSKQFLTIVMIATLFGCASTQTTFTPPSDVQMETEKFLPLNFDAVWDNYVAELSKSFFVINNISKESRIINVSFSTNSPGEYIDCGSITRTTVHPSIGEKTFHYAVADSSSYLYGIKGTNTLWQINRVTKLSGRANVYIAPRGQETLVRANAKYVWTVSKTGTANVGGSTSGSYSTDFSTQQAGSLTGTEEGKTVTVICQSRGTLERQLLDLIAG